VLNHEPASLGIYMNVSAYRGKLPVFGSGVFVHPSAVVIGDVTTGDDVSFWPQSVTRGDVNSIRIGDRSNVQDGAVLHVTHDGPYTPGGRELIIGCDVTIAHKVTLHACTLGDRILIGIGAIVLDDAVIEADVMVAAGSLVPPGKILHSGGLYKGTPAVRVRDLKDREIENLSYSARHYVRVKNHHMES
jgi:carbonic anhydrase/acetyltransferase-like protein (isoleucine patch superfamily)